MKLFVILFVSLAAAAPIAANDSGLFSRNATPIWQIAASQHGLASPDSASVIHAVEGDQDCCWPFRAWVTHNGKNYPLPFGGFVSSEVSWSADSKAFFVTYSDGGSIGTFHVWIYRVDDVGVHGTEPVSPKLKALQPHCLTGDYPNVGAIQWGSTSDTLVIAVEVPPQSGCRHMGTFTAFEVSLPSGDFLKKYSQREAKKIFAATLGRELLNADDSF